MMEETEEAMLEGMLMVWREMNEVLSHVNTISIAKVGRKDALGEILDSEN